MVWPFTKKGANPDEVAPVMAPDLETSVQPENTKPVPPPVTDKTLAEDFRSQKFLVLIALGCALILFVFNFFSVSILNIIACVVGIIAGVTYFLYCFVMKRFLKVFVFAGLGAGLVATVSGIWTLAAMIKNIVGGSISATVGIPVTIIWIILLLLEGLLYLWVGFKGWRVHHGAKKAEQMMEKARAFARQVG